MMVKDVEISLKIRSRTHFVNTYVLAKIGASRSSNLLSVTFRVVDTYVRTNVHNASLHNTVQLRRNGMTRRPKYLARHHSNGQVDI